MALLEARGMALDLAQRDRILGERDLARIARAIACASVDELLAEP